MVPNIESEYILLLVLLLGYSISYKEYYLTRFNNPKKHYSIDLPSVIIMTSSTQVGQVFSQGFQACTPKVVPLGFGILLGGSRGLHGLI